MSTFAGLKRPEFTGSNRCWPCTVLNVALLALVVGVLVPFRPIPAAAAAVVGTAVIWLRGYLVPYTPRFAPKLAARLPGGVFDHSTRADSLEDVRAGAEDGEAVLEALVEAGVVTVDGDRLGLRDSVADAWRARMSALAGSPGALVEAAEQDVAGIDTARVEALDDETYLVVTGESTAWLPDAVAVAEVGAVQALADTDLPAARRELAAHALCAFLDACPVCGDDVVEGQADDCCGHTVPDPSYEPPTVLACENCGVAFYTLEQPADADG
jgi:hypothetical protein